jgi:hypothetical protein
MDKLVIIIPAIVVLTGLGIIVFACFQAHKLFKK